MMNPLYYVVGKLNPGAAPHWWIRHGTTESGISRAAVVNFSTAPIVDTPAPEGYVHLLP